MNNAERKMTNPPRRALLAIISVFAALLTSGITCAEIERRTESVDPMYQEDEIDVMVDYGATLQAEETATAIAGETATAAAADEPDEEIEEAPAAPDPQVEEEEESNPLQVFTFSTKYSGRYTDVLSQEVGGSAQWKCSQNDSYWHDVIFTYEYNNDGTLTLVEISVDGETLDGGPWKTYVPINDHTFVEEHETGNGVRKETLTFSTTQLKVTIDFHHTDGSTGTCINTIKPVTE